MACGRSSRRRRSRRCWRRPRPTARRCWRFPAQDTIKEVAGRPGGAHPRARPSLAGADPAGVPFCRHSRRPPARRGPPASPAPTMPPWWNGAAGPSTVCPAARTISRLPRRPTWPWPRALLVAGVAEECLMRIGHGFDVHRLVPDRPLILGGVTIPWHLGLLGHSDADVLLHAICDAMLGALGLGDIGKHFPDTDPAYQGIDSIRLLEHVVGPGRDAGLAGRQSRRHGGGPTAQARAAYPGDGCTHRRGCAALRPGRSTSRPPPPNNSATPAVARGSPPMPWC